MTGEGRPTGVTILAILEAIAGVYYLATGFNVSIYRTLVRLAFGIASIDSIFVGAALIIIGLVSLFLAWGLWTGKGWARMTALVFAILSLIVSLISRNLFGLVIDLIIVYYLTRPNVKQFFTK
ncbi:MAG: hypothetical protein ABSA92_03120 [Candidatus Bathyarchaeia archaeon]|jgi:uncharacterized membrane protein (DUF2068 family)